MMRAATSILDAHIGLFPGTSATPSAHVPLRIVLEHIRDGKYTTAIARLRAIDRARNADAYRKAKEQLLAFTPGCDLTSRAKGLPWAEKLLHCTGVLHYDYDHLEDPQAWKAQLAADPHACFAFVSPGGHGVKMGFAATGITDPASYKRAWRAFATYLNATYPAQTFTEDHAVSALNSLCFVSDDPTVYLCGDPAIFAVPPPVPRQEHRPPQASESDDDSRVTSALASIPNVDSYDVWITLGMSLHSTGQPWARGLWDQWSSRSEKYDPRAQEAKWQSFHADGKVTMGTLFYLAREAGWQEPPPSRLKVKAQPRPVPIMGQAALSPDAATEQYVPDAGAWLHGSDAQGTPRLERSAGMPITIGIDLSRMTDEAIDALLLLKNMDGAPMVYQRARRLSLIARGVKAPRWLHRPPDAPVIIEASPATLYELLGLAASWTKYDAKKKDWIEAAPPVRIVPTIQGRPSWPFPVLEGIIHTPTLRPDGSGIHAGGYDPDTALFVDFNGTLFPPVPDHPDIFDAQGALTVLKDVIQDFCWAQPYDQSAALAAILSLVCRFTVKGNVPLFGVTATVRGSGKGMLADVISIIGTGRQAPLWAQAEDDAEERKRLLALGLDGDPLICLDNINRPLGSGPLDLALTSSTFKDRLLGTQTALEVPMHAIFMATGNNVQFLGDLARRVVPIHLDPKLERPEERTGFKYPDLLAHVRQQRPALVVAAITVLKAYFEDGCPQQDLSAYGSFQPWSDLIRSALVWAGERDCCEGRKDIEARNDPEFGTIATLLAAWFVCYPQGDDQHSPRITLAALKDATARNMGITPHPRNQWNDLNDALTEIDAKQSTTKIGHVLRKAHGRVVSIPDPEHTEKDAPKQLLVRLLKAEEKSRTNQTQWCVEPL
jgi:hypothetical protein